MSGSLHYLQADLHDLSRSSWQKNGSARPSYGRDRRTPVRSLVPTRDEPPRGHTFDLAALRRIMAMVSGLRGRNERMHNSRNTRGLDAARAVGSARPRRGMTTLRGNPVTRTGQRALVPCGESALQPTTPQCEPVRARVLRLVCAKHVTEPYHLTAAEQSLFLGDKMRVGRVGERR